MNVTLLRALVALIPTFILFTGAMVLFARRRAAGSFLQLFGAGCLMVVILAHICEGLRLFRWMNWGLERSAGHYLALGSALLGLTLFSIGYLVYAVTQRHV